jgi:hypothetical protein
MYLVFIRFQLVNLLVCYGLKGIMKNPPLPKPTPERKPTSVRKPPPAAETVAPIPVAGRVARSRAKAAAIITQPTPVKPLPSSGSTDRLPRQPQSPSFVPAEYNGRMPGNCSWVRGNAVRMPYAEALVYAPTEYMDE